MNPFIPGDYAKFTYLSHDNAKRWIDACARHGVDYAGAYLVVSVCSDIASIQIGSEVLNCYCHDLTRVDPPVPAPASVACIPEQGYYFRVKNPTPYFMVFCRDNNLHPKSLGEYHGFSEYGAKTTLNFIGNDGDQAVFTFDTADLEKVDPQILVRKLVNRIDQLREETHKARSARNRNSDFLRNIEKQLRDFNDGY